MCFVFFFTKYLDCSDLANPINGRVSVTGLALGSQAVYECNRGYMLLGARTRTCLSTGQWSPSPPMCNGEVIKFTEHQEMVMHV